MRLSALALLLLAGFAAGAEPLATIETVGAVRALQPAEAARHYPVKLRGAVTFYTALDGHAFLQDETGGIFFRPGVLGQAGRVEFTAGERVEISGVTMSGGFSPSVAGGPAMTGAAPIPVAVVRLGAGVLPVPPQVTIEQIQTGQFHDQFVQVRATVRGVDPHAYRGGRRIGLTLSAARGAEGLKVKAYVAHPDEPPAGWEDTVADIRGVVAGGGDEKARLRDVRLLVPSPAHVTPDAEFMRGAFAQEPRPIGELFRYEPPEARGASHYLRVRGIVTLVLPGEGLYVGTSGAGLWVQTPQHGAAAGDQLDVIGPAARDERRAFLQDGIFRMAGHGALPPARVATAAEAASGKLGAVRTAVEGELVDKLQQPGFRRLTLESKGGVFHARILGDPTSGEDWRTGSQLRITGICEPVPAAAPPASFTMIVGSAADVAVIGRPPWLSARQLRWVALALALASSLSVLWVAVLRRHVARQTAIIAKQTAHKTITEERHRIARELHDTLEQQLAGVHLHLDAVNDWLPEAPADVRDALRTARAMLEHSRTEARQSVFELRSPALEQLGLVGAVHHSAAQLAEPGAPRIEVLTNGPERRLPRAVEFHLLRIVQESITNALKHAHAREIFVTFDFDHAAVRIVVRDDGRGFDPERRPGDGQAHFGHIGMRERVAKIQGRITIASAPGEGASVSIEVPVAL